MDIRGHEFAWGRRTYIMGVVNVTPDSFSDGGVFFDADRAVAMAVRQAEAGADILDIGGESTRPYAQPVSEAEELRRVLPVIRQIRQHTQCPISIDTTKAAVAEAALEAGADIVNDISALRFDPEMAKLVAKAQVPVILMHMKGRPQDMQKRPSYEDVVGEVREFLQERTAWAVEQGVGRDRIWLDPGIGFGKRLEDNLALMAGLDSLLALGAPMVVGPSRKAFLGAITGIEEPSARDLPTLGAVASCAVSGAHVVRVHNVGMTRPVLQVVDAIHRGRKAS